MGEKEFQVGDEVLVRYRSRPGTYPGEITKVGRKLVTIACKGISRSIQVPMDTQQDPDGFYWFQTPEQHAAEQRLAAARKALEEAGLRLAPGVRFPVERLELLAAFASTPHRWYTVAVVEGDQGGTCVDEFKQAGLSETPELREWLESVCYYDNPDLWLLAWQDGENIGEVNNIFAMKQFQFPEE